MDLLLQFVDFLLSQKHRPSLLTVKNYKADIKQFIDWFEKEFNSVFDSSKITLPILDQYKKTRSLSPSSIQRHISSLRKFFHFLKLEGIISQNPLEKKTVSAETQALEDPWKIRNFKNFLYEYKKSNLTIKNYINDIKSFFAWLEEAVLVKYSWNVADRNLLEKINFSVIQEYKQRLIAAKFSSATINRKLSSLRSYIGWAKGQGLISSGHAPCHPEFISGSPARRQDSLQTNEILNQVQNDKAEIAYSPFPPIRLIQKSLSGINFLFDNLFILPLAQIISDAEHLLWKISGKRIFSETNAVKTNAIKNIQKEFYAPLDISLTYLPFYKRILHYIRHARPNWYKKYHSYSITHYFHFAILMIISCAAGFGIYNGLFADTGKNAVLGISASSSPRILSFQGRLTDSSETPITKDAAILFSLYNDADAPAADALWQENNIVKPNQDGIFSISLGEKAPISDTVFSQNSRLFLGIAVGNSPELLPRQEIATVLFADNSETLQGLEPITNTAKSANVVLALDSSGNLSIAGGRTHAFQVIGGGFVLSGKVLSLTTVPGSNGNIEIAPDGMGMIDLAKPIQNSTNNNNLLDVPGAVEFDDAVAILATSSAYSAFTINQNSTGSLISASTSGIARFTVDNDGNGTFAGGVRIDGGDLTSINTTFNLLDSGVKILNIGSAATTINLGTPSGTMNFKSNVNVSKDFSLSSLTSNGGILYTNESGKVYQVSAGSNSDCLLGGTTPAFASCSKIFGATAPLFKLDVWDSQSATAAAQIFNTAAGTDADGLIIKLGNTNPTVDNANHFISFETSGIGIVGSIRGQGTGVQYQTNGVADFAEYFKKDKDQIIEYGSVICLKDSGLAVKCSHDNNKIIGVASEYPAFLGGENLGDKSVAVGLVGQVETFVTLINGEIKTGDVLTASDIPGVAVKATKTGQIIGKALEDLSGIDESKIVGFYDPDNKEYRSKAGFPDIPLKPNIVPVVKISTLVNVSWYDPGAYLAQNGEFIVRNTGPNEYSVSNSKNETLTNIEGFFEVVAANIKAGYVHAQALTVAGLINASEIVAQSLIITSDSVIVNGQNLKDYIAGVVDELRIKNQESRIISPIIRAQEISADIISPLGESLIVRLATPSAEIHDSSFIIQNSSGSAVAKIDDQGNASFSGTINSLSLETNNASISGTLRAGNIFADSIEGLEAKVSSIVDLASYSAQLSYVPDLAAERAQFNQGLMVFGPASLSDLALAGQLSIGSTMFLTDNSIETLGADLFLQSLKQGGLSIMAGLVYIDTDGNVKIQGDLFVRGSLAVNIISPLPTSDLIINNASGSGVLSVNQAGDIISSGSATFSKLNFSLVSPVLALSATEVIASSSAGIASIASYQSEITIRNALVTDKSVIYITPVGTPSAQTPFLMRQVPDGFTVGVQSPTNRPIDFNWLIVN